MMGPQCGSTRGGMLRVHMTTACMMYAVCMCSGLMLTALLATRDGHRLTFAVGDFVQFHNDKTGRLDHIFLHDMSGLRYIFLILTKLRKLAPLERVLGVPRMELTDEPVLIGLPAIQGSQRYIIDIPNVGLVWINWEIITL